MNIQAEVSLYPLGDEEYSERIDAFIETLIDAGLDVNLGTMATSISGDLKEIFTILTEAFEEDAELGPAVMTLKVINESR